MSEREIYRFEIMEKLKNKQLRQPEAAKLLQVTVRQVKRIWSRYKSQGAAGLVSRHRGKSGTRLLSNATIETARALIKEHYYDFGPTLAHEKLLEQHHLKLSVEKVRQLMIQDGLWLEKRRKRIRIHQQRERRSCVGELVQIDGSPHAWFEGRSPKCTLLTLIDDAKGQIFGLRFCDAETTQDYFTLVKRYFIEEGLPVSLYSDRHSIFKVNIKEAVGGDGHTQFSRAMQQLDIALIHANSPQAKGRVERLNQTLQDRLVKEMRLRNINTQEQGNAFLPEFIKDFNARFAVQAKCDTNAHRELNLSDKALGHILSLHSYRTLSKNLECSYNNVTYQIQAQDRKYRMQNTQVLICENSSQEIFVFNQDKQLEYKTIDKENRSQQAIDAKELDHHLDVVVPRTRKGTKPKPGNPWSKFIINHKRHYQNKSKHQIT